MPRPKSNKEVEGLRRLVHQHLTRRASVAVAPEARSLSGRHLDEDALSVFVEGRLNEREAAPIVSHLVACASCRNITAQLVRLAFEVDATDPQVHSAPEATEPGRIRRLLESLSARVLPSSDEVFAYHAPAEDFASKPEAAPENSTDSEEEKKS